MVSYYSLYALNAAVEFTLYSSLWKVKSSEIHESRGKDFLWDLIRKRNVLVRFHFLETMKQQLFIFSNQHA